MANLSRWQNREKEETMNSSNSPSIHCLKLGDRGVSYVKKAIEKGASARRPLADMLTGADITDAFAFIAASSCERAEQDFNGMYIGSTQADELLESSIACWIGEERNANRQRVLVLEEFLAKRSDPAPSLDTDYFFGEWTYSICTTPTQREVSNAFAGLVSHPGIGVLSSPGLHVFSDHEIMPESMTEIAAATSAVLVSAWDDEAFIVAPVSNRINSETMMSIAKG
ncbi:MAG: hypothetical protein HY827_08995 [Actinobacteria bacterium]|nr:hypothetical protein [Actinomycetota bacterium]